MNFKVSSPDVSNADAIKFADELERVIGEIGNGKRNPKNIPLEPMVALIQFARTAANAVQDVRNQALEEAAKVCDLWNEAAGKHLAGEIRALKTAAPDGGA